MIRILISLLLLMPCTAFAQKVDTTYIQKRGHLFSVSPYFSQDFFVLTIEQGSTETEYAPNTSPKVGLGFSINNTIIDFGYGFGFGALENKDKYGKTKAFDLQLHHYNRRFVLDLYIQRYNGFYIDGDEIVKCPDMRVNQSGLYGHYIFNHRKYSYKAAFVRNEKQLRSAGSFLVGGGVHQTNIKSDSSFVYNGKNSLDNFQFGISVGYAHTWVLGRYFDISASGTMGVNFGCERASRFGKDKLKVHPVVIPRISAGYNKDKWGLGLSYIMNFYFPAIEQKSNVTMNTGRVQLSFIKRFYTTPSWKKRSRNASADTSQ